MTNISKCDMLYLLVIFALTVYNVHDNEYVYNHIKEIETMTINKNAEGSKLTVAIEGRLDTTTAPQLEADLKGSLDGVTDLVLDFVKLDYISSAGLRVLLSTQKQMNKVGKMTLISVSPEIMEIFVDVQQEEYEKLAPLAAKMFIRNTKRQQIYMKPDKYSESTTEEEWKENFYEPLRSGRVPGEVLDMQIMYPLSLEANKEAWKMSKFEGVKEYMLEQL